VVSDKEREEVHIVDENTKLFHKGLSIEEVVGGDQKIPGERSEPGEVVHLVDSIANVDDLSKTLNLNQKYCDHQSQGSTIYNQADASKH